MHGDRALPQHTQRFPVGLGQRIDAARRLRQLLLELMAEGRDALDPEQRGVSLDGMDLPRTQVRVIATRARW